MNTIYNQLKESPLLYLSGGSKELFQDHRDGSFDQLSYKPYVLRAS